MITQVGTHEVLDTIGLIVSIPVIGMIASGVYFISQIKNTAETTNQALEGFAKEVKDMLKDHELRLRTEEGKVAVLWDGHERRATQHAPLTPILGG